MPTVATMTAATADIGHAFVNASVVVTPATTMTIVSRRTQSRNSAIGTVVVFGFNSSWRSTDTRASSRRTFYAVSV